MRAFLDADEAISRRKTRMHEAFRASFHYRFDGGKCIGLRANTLERAAKHYAAKWAPTISSIRFRRC